MLYISDLDGTLLGPDARLSDFSRRHLGELLDRGLHFTVASARSAVSIRGVLGPLSLRLPVIGFNGGFVSDLPTGRHHHVEGLAPDLARRVWELGRAAGLQPIVSTSDGVSVDRVFIAVERNAGVQMYVSERERAADPRLRFVLQPEVRATQKVTCLTVIDRRDAVEALAAQLLRFGDALQPHLFDDMYTPGWSWLTVHGGGATKAHGARWLQAHAGLGKHPIVAFGDQDNDLPLLQIADHAVATANASPAVLAVADEVIGHHRDDAVVRWLLERAELPD